MIFSFEDLQSADLVPGAIYKSGPTGGLVGEPISKIFKLEYGLRGIGNQSGIRRSMVEKKGYKDEEAFIVLVNRKSEKKWPNYYDESTGILTYYGDNKTPGNDYLNTKQRGNFTFNKIFSRAYNSKEDRYTIPPIFYFEKIKNRW